MTRQKITIYSYSCEVCSDAIEVARGDHYGKQVIGGDGLVRTARDADLAARSCGWTNKGEWWACTNHHAEGAGA